jgi:hypothetical protein
MNQEQSRLIKDFNKYIEKTWKHAVLRFMDDEEFSPPYNPKFNLFIDQISKEAEKESRNNLQPWISVIDFAILWLSSVHILIEEDRSENDNPDLLTPWALTGAACSQAVAIRKLCMCGLDNSAKIILRTLTEALNTCTITLYDPSLRKQYQAAQDFNESYKVWNDHFRDKQIYTVLKEIMEKMNLDSEIQNLFLDYQKEEKRLLHQTVHTTYTAAAFASRVQSSDQRTFPSAIFGASTIFSVRTLAFACKSIWLFSLIGFRLLFKPLDMSQPLLQPKPHNTWTKIIASSFFVLNETIPRYWDTDRIEVQ